MTVMGGLVHANTQKGQGGALYRASVHNRGLLRRVEERADTYGEAESPANRK